MNKTITKIQEHLKNKGQKITHLAIKNKIAPSVFSRFLSGKQVSAQNALKIYNALEGVVTLSDIISVNSEVEK